MEVLLGLVLLAAVLWFVGGPVRIARAAPEDEAAAARRADLEAAKQAKFAEIRELELDFRTGKVDEEDFRAQDRRLRTEAVTLLRRLDELSG